MEDIQDNRHHHSTPEWQETAGSAKCFRVMHLNLIQPLRPPCAWTTYRTRIPEVSVQGQRSSIYLVTTRN